MIQRFNRWFSSAAGVWQTVAVTLALATTELIDPHLDPHGFWLLYWLTVYSSVTQPVLANTGRQEMERLARLETQQIALMAHIEDMAERIEATNEAQLAWLGHLHFTLAELVQQEPGVCPPGPDSGEAQGG